MFIISGIKNRIQADLMKEILEENYDFAMEVIKEYPKGYRISSQQFIGNLSKNELQVFAAGILATLERK